MAAHARIGRGFMVLVLLFIVIGMMAVPKANAQVVIVGGGPVIMGPPPVVYQPYPYFSGCFYPPAFNPYGIPACGYGYGYGYPWQGPYYGFRRYNNRVYNGSSYNGW